MANDFIPIQRDSNNATQAQKLIRFAELLKEVHYLLDDIDNLMGHMHDGAIFTEVEAQFGLEVGQGAIVATALANFKTSWDGISGPSVKQIIGRLGAGSHTA